MHTTYTRIHPVQSPPTQIQHTLSIYLISPLHASLVKLPPTRIQHTLSSFLLSPLYVFLDHCHLQMYMYSRHQLYPKNKLQRSSCCDQPSFLKMMLHSSLNCQGRWRYCRCWRRWKERMTRLNNNIITLESLLSFFFTQTQTFSRKNLQMCVHQVTTRSRSLHQTLSMFRTLPKTRGTQHTTKIPKNTRSKSTHTKCL